jgi:polyphenol oxidase
MAELIQSPLMLELTHVSHGFSCRAGGVSQSPFDSLNLAYHTPDVAEDVTQNRRIAAMSILHAAHDIVTARQVHGSRCVQVGTAADDIGEADALWSQQGGIVLGVMVADCVPILITERKGRSIAAIHAGWRGTAARITATCADALICQGAKVQDLVAAVGPAIGPCCFEIGEEVAKKMSALSRQRNPGLCYEKDGRWRADLWELNREILLQKGFVSENIDVLRVCTYCSPRFFSYRRDGPRSGRQAGLIALKPL